MTNKWAEFKKLPLKNKILIALVTPFAAVIMTAVWYIDKLRSKRWLARR